MLPSLRGMDATTASEMTRRLGRSGVEVMYGAITGTPPPLRLVRLSGITADAATAHHRLAARSISGELLPTPPP